METAFLLGYHRNRQSLCKPPLIAHIRFPGRLEYLLEDTPPVFKYKYKQILFWSGTHLCLTSYAILYVRVILNIGVTCDTGQCVRAGWVYEPGRARTFVPNLWRTTSKNTTPYSTSDITQNMSKHYSSTFLWTLQSFSQSEVLLDKSYTMGNKQARNGAKWNKQNTLLSETSRKQAMGWLQLSKSFEAVAVLTSK